MRLKSTANQAIVIIPMILISAYIAAYAYLRFNGTFEVVGGKGVSPAYPFREAVILVPESYKTNNGMGFTKTEWYIMKLFTPMRYIEAAIRN